MKRIIFFILLFFSACSQQSLPPGSQAARVENEENTIRFFPGDIIEMFHNGKWENIDSIRASRKYWKNDGGIQRSVGVSGLLRWNPKDSVMVFSQPQGMQNKKN